MYIDIRMYVRMYVQYVPTRSSTFAVVQQMLFVKYVRTYTQHAYYVYGGACMSSDTM